MRQINKIIIHCSATAADVDYSPEQLERDHNARGINLPMGYHYYILKDGTIVKGREVSVIGAHARGHNRDSIGICYEGGLKAGGSTWRDAVDTRTVQQRGVMAKLVYTLWIEHGKPEIIGHNEISNKACPSFDVQNWVKSLRW